MTETRVKYLTKADLRQSEKDFQAQVVDLLHMEGLLVYEFGKPGGHRALAGTVSPGWPDLLVIMEGTQQHPHPVYLHIELKAKDGKRSPDQERVRRELWEKGCNVFVVKSLEEMANVLRCRGYKMKTQL